MNPCCIQQFTNYCADRVSSRHFQHALEMYRKGDQGGSGGGRDPDPGTAKNRDGPTAPIYGEMIPWLKIERDIRAQNYPDCPWGFRRGAKPIKNFVKA